MDLYQKFDHDIFDVTKILIGLSLTDGQKAELSKIAGEIDAAYSSGQLTAHERSRLLGTIKDCGMEPLPIKKNECPRNLPKRKTRGHDRLKKKGETLSNQVTNFISFGNGPEQVAAFHKMLRELRQEDGVYGSLDFNKLIPMPEPMNIESGTWTNQGLQAYRSFMAGRKNAETFKKEHPDAWELGRQAYENIQKYGYPTWFEWRIQHWGTRCNAYSCVELRQGDQTMRFETAWRRVLEIVRALSKKYPDQTVTYRWADAELGADVGEAVF